MRCAHACAGGHCAEHVPVRAVRGGRVLWYTAVNRNCFGVVRATHKFVFRLPFSSPLGLPQRCRGFPHSLRLADASAIVSVARRTAGCACPQQCWFVLNRTCDSVLHLESSKRVIHPVHDIKTDYHVHIIDFGCFVLSGSRSEVLLTFSMLDVTSPPALVLKSNDANPQSNRIAEPCPIGSPGFTACRVIMGNSACVLTNSSLSGYICDCMGPEVPFSQNQYCLCPRMYPLGRLDRPYVHPGTCPSGSVLDASCNCRCAVPNYCYGASCFSGVYTNGTAYSAFNPSNCSTCSCCALRKPLSPYHSCNGSGQRHVSLWIHPVGRSLLLQCAPSLHGDSLLLCERRIQPHSVQFPAWLQRLRLQYVLHGESFFWSLCAAGYPPMCSQASLTQNVFNSNATWRGNYTCNGQSLV